MLNIMKNKRVIVIASAQVLGMILLLLIIIDFTVSMQKNISVYKESQNLLADSMLDCALVKLQKDGGDFTDHIVSYIKEKYPTSSSTYCIFAKNDEIVFLKDDNTTSTLIDDKISNFFNNKNISSRDRRKYIVSKAEISLNGDEYTLIVCTRQNYFIKKIGLYNLRFHFLEYFAIYGILLIVIIVFTFYRLRSKENSIKALGDEVKKNRLIIEKLENDRNKNYADSEKEEDYSFYNRSIVDEVIKNMSKEDKEKCIQIDISVENIKMEHFVFITTILGRIKEGSSIACYWEDNLFKVLLLHSNQKEAREFIQLFIRKYKAESEEKVDELKIVASRLSGGSYGL